MSSSIDIQSHIGVYRASFVDDALSRLNAFAPQAVHFVIDARVARLYADRLAGALAAPSVLIIDADEHAKSLERMPAYIEHLAVHDFKRNHRLVAVGGGVVQDISCFLAAVMMRGVNWSFFPTTLLAQADSCIGSKSSINVGAKKNIIGTFTPPNEIFIDVGFLRTLDERELRSGVGEILKIHAIDSPAAFDKVAGDYDRLFADKAVMAEYIRGALLIKKPFIEDDEFDRGSRQVLNYGHSFGHAIESATDFALPHGIAVTMGLDLANFAAWRLGSGNRQNFDRMHKPLRRNYTGYESLAVPLDRFLDALSRDKKNTNTREVAVILPDIAGRPTKVNRSVDSDFISCCTEYFDRVRGD